jgi:hypothetical protein
MVKIYRWSQSAGKKHMININDLFWLAGIIDGEGYLTANARNGIHRTCNNGKGQFSLVTRIGIGNTDFGIIKKVSEIYCDLGVKFYYTLHSINKKFPNSMRMISIDVEGYRSCKKILEVIIDKSASISKKKQIRLTLDYINYRLSLIQKREQLGHLKTKVTYEDFIKIDMKFAKELKESKICQVSPSTTKRKASTVLQW